MFTSTIISLLVAAPVLLAHAETNVPDAASAPGSVCNTQIQPVGRSTIGQFTGNAALDAVITGGSLAHNVCGRVNHGARSDHPCLAYADVVGQMVAGLIAMGTYSSSGFTKAVASRRRSADATDHSTTLLNIFADHLFEQGYAVGGVEVHPQTDQERRRDSTAESSASNTVAASFALRDVVHPNQTFTAADLLLTTYVDGTGTLLVKHQLPGQTKRSANHDGPGFKYNYRYEVLADAARNQNIVAIANAVGSAIGNQWGFVAENTAMDQWIGAVGIDYILLQALGVGFRIIAETNGFGEEYEDIGICGNDMASRIREQLK
ncbi:hypothetical protein SBRCBS47491_001712 [Sporothrix bragantina]|uniref:Uncharacterized protein n=1 Tax=Sporothrix bragantina TaxID=671064 RepID=A0ABP0B0Z2_9PEZI